MPPPVAGDPVTTADSGFGNGSTRRELGFWMCTALVVGNIIGMGVFMQPASLAPFGWNSIIAWLITAAGCMALAVVFANLARALPRADGPIDYMRSTLGEGAALLSLWCYWVSLWVTNAALTVGVVGYLMQVLPAGAPAVPAVLISVALIWLFVGINLLGARAGGRVQVITTLLKLAPIVVVITLGLWRLLVARESYVGNISPAPFSLEATMTASTIALFAMAGLESATIPAGRVRDAAVTIPRATVVGTGLAAIVYLAITAIALFLVPHAVLSESTAPFVAVFERLAGAGRGEWIAYFVVISGLGALNGWTLLVGELTRSLAAQRLLPAALARVNSRGAPASALLATGLLATVAVVMNYSRSLVEGFTFLSVVVTAATLPLYLCCSAALLVLMVRGNATLPRGMLWFGIGGAVYAVFAFIGVGAEAFLWAVVLAAAGLPFFLLQRYGRAK